jgi:hypothetical protein
MRRILASPALHFLVSGAALLAVDRTYFAPETEASAGRARIEIAASGLEAEIDDGILLAEARARGLESSDPVVRARIARNLAFLEAETSTTRIDDALALGLARGDLVVRRRLVERMRAELSSGATRRPSEAEIAGRFARDAARHARPARVRIAHVFLSRDRRGATLDADVARLRARLESGSLALSEAIALGDPFLLGHTLPPRSQADLARDFGDAFARAVFALEPGVVSPPIASSYGVHWVIVAERSPETPASLEDARAEIIAELEREQETAALRSALTVLRERYEIRVARAEP